MTEPEYTYVKGQGWVIGPAVTVLTIEYIVTGTNILRRVVCEERTPNTGERAWWWFEGDFNEGPQFFLHDIIQFADRYESGYPVGYRDVVPGWAWGPSRPLRDRKTFAITTYRLRGNSWVLETDERT